MKKVHLIGICGTAMAALASMLQERGWQVSGSDAAAYPPMSDLLAARGIEVMSGYEAGRLDQKLALVVVGNVAAQSNVEAVRAQELGLCCCSLPETLWHEFLSSSEHRLVVAGTHGKTSTASMLAWALESCGAEPSFMIGGELNNFSTNYRLGRGKSFVLEGDEYNSAFFDRHAKFHHYRASHLIITGIEMDHIDLFSSIDEIIEEFQKLIAALPATGLLVAAADCPVLKKLLPEAPCKVLTYGWSEDADFRLLDYRALDDGGQISFSDPGNEQEQIKVSAIGRHNGENALAVAILLKELGFSPATVAQGLGSFKGVKRRQELVGRSGETIYLSDFAHHPTAIKRTLEALREHYPEHHLLAVFEPRTATSRCNLFQKDLEAAFSAADEVLLAPVHGLAKMEKDEALDTALLANAIQRGAMPARAVAGIDELYDILKERAGRKELVVLMSTGDFGGLFYELAQNVWLEKAEIG
ncbi:MAG: UDP-N-acetylmuramate:L-alanyl-gamma-D-glutamyl-meso-diaminopimelate ligase [Deltaproteobacteria bacterium]|nr:UDP-N-acetylmuramate:L-alanyl-gamma-D-glutamyl-meso-diaminopimelate ligase [Candidatus Tharpella aukensis]